MAARGGPSAPSSVAEGLKDVLQSIMGCMTAPDATAYAMPLMQLQTQTLGMLHKMTSPQGGAVAAPGQPPAGAGPRPPMPAQPMGGPQQGLAALQGAQQGPSAAVSGGASPSGVDPEQIRQLVAAQASGTT